MNNNLQKWLQVHGITRSDLLCLAFVPRRTYEDLARGASRPIPALHRLHMVTGLKEFELNQTEVEKYQMTSQAELSVQIDEKIASAFLTRWRSEQILPKGEERIVSKGQVKSELSKKLIVSLFTNVAPTQSNFASIFSELETVLNGPNDKLVSYLKANAEKIKALSSIINVILQDNPKAALAILKNSKKLFN